MCGIVGIISPNNNEELVKNLTYSLKHRGPDDHGSAAHHSCTIINTRLSIIDLEHGHQPFLSDDKQIAVVQNGEIYNYIEVREKLISQGCVFHTESDTEVILKAYELYGYDFVTHLNGMFAIAIIDKRQHNLTIYRDRLGVKPLYYYLDGESFMFSSEIKSFLRAEFFRKEINLQAVHNFLVFNYIPLPDTIFKNVHHIKPGTFLQIHLSDLTTKEVVYWQIANEEEDLIQTEDQYIETIEELLFDATKIRLRSDVPVGAFLSGGLDSSLVCAVASKIKNEQFNTFTIGFKEESFDETPYAKYVTDAYGLNFHVKTAEEDIIGMWNKVTWHNDQPHGDISFIPTFMLSAFASEKHKVVLTGDGADELFAGYTKYFSLFDTEATNKSYFDAISLFEEGVGLSSIYTDHFRSKVNLNEAFQFYSDTIGQISNKDSINQALYFDTVQLLPGNNLVKPDKMAMANSLETRSPFLDYRFFSLLFRIPGKVKLQHPADTKYILKKLALKYFKHDHVYRKKQMFTVPIGEWFKANLASYLIDIVSSSSLASREIFDMNILKMMAEQHIKGTHNYTRELRAIVNLEIWFRKFID